jgi:hypothetical protein
MDTQKQLNVPLQATAGADGVALAAAGAAAAAVKELMKPWDAAAAVKQEQFFASVSRLPGVRGSLSGVTIWNKIDFVVDFHNLLFGGDFDLSFSKGYSLDFFNYEVDFTAKCDT